MDMLYATVYVLGGILGIILFVFSLLMPICVVRNLPKIIDEIKLNRAETFALRREVRSLRQQITQMQEAE